MEPGGKLKVSFRLFVLNVIGALLAAFGLASLVGQAETALVPVWLAVLMLLAGLGLMGWFMVDIFKRIRAQQSAR
ncbi:hypothetical protein [Chitinimonas sp.]|uniref:hypothetical protein n=1 Tax=Chitinimonas sp. TaxID=1934313 RepID=UPI002F9557FE